MKIILDGMRLGATVFVAFITLKLLVDLWKAFWGFLASLLENAEKKAEKKEKDRDEVRDRAIKEYYGSVWNDSTNAEVDDGK